MQSQPGLPGGILAYHQPNTSSDATKIASYCYDIGQSRQSTNLSDVLRCSFSLKHRELSHADAEATKHEEDHEDETAKDTKPKNSKKPPCWQIGVCVCSEQGEKFYHLAQRFINVSKLQFPASGSLRTSHLKTSKIFVLLRGCSIDEADKEKPSFQTEILWHIGIHYLTPYRPTFRGATVSGDVNASAVPVVGTNDYVTMWPALQKLSLDLAWFAKFYTIRESEMPIGSFQPAKATMLPLLPEVGKQFWPPPKRTRARVRTAADDLEADPDAEEDCNAAGGLQPEDEAMDIILEEAFGALVAANEENGDADAAVDSDTNTAEAEAKAKAPAPVPEPDDSDDSSDSSSSSSSDSSSDSGNDTCLRGSADVALKVPGGVIRYYANKNAFTATCSNPNHERCVLTRTALPAANVLSTNPNVCAKGRPLGYMMSWLAMSESTADKAAHWSPARSPDFATRAAARARLADLPRGASLLAHERDLRAGEGPEPIGLP